jgi:hypothetical protein
MFIEVICDGETLDVHDFKVQPQRGETIEFPCGTVVKVEDIRHNFKRGKLQAWCTKHTPNQAERPLAKQRSKTEES